MDNMNQIDLDVLVKCLLCLDSVKVKGFQKRYKNFNNQSSVSNIVFSCSDIVGKRVDGYTDNGIFCVYDFDDENKELFSSSLLHRIADLARIQGYITKERYEQRYKGIIYSVPKMYNQVSKELLADIQKHMFEQQCYNSSSNLKRPHEIIHYDLQLPIEVRVYINNSSNDILVGHYSCEDIEAIRAHDAKTQDLTQLGGNQKVISDTIDKNAAEKGCVVLGGLSRLNSCREQAINRFEVKYKKLYSVR